MTERLVDILDANGLILHTYPIPLDSSGGDRSDAEYQAKALEAAAPGRLVPDEQLTRLTTRMHLSRAGRLQPTGDLVDSDSETRLGLEKAVRERAYRLWEQDGRPEGRADEYWYRALDQHLRERAYVSWQQEGSRIGDADADWNRLRTFQSPRSMRGSICKGRTKFPQKRRLKNPQNGLRFRR